MGATCYATRLESGHEKARRSGPTTETGGVEIPWPAA